ncbi:MAG: lipocalin family protein [Luminiphilus sp.]|jgi:apolipoprotein D and lipocalin family protein|nr:lipocalin family protein [Pseudomonadales bacterium]MBL6901230.1 lipocalin family protein [Luminiphilus sp.]CAI8438637.1 MAG: Outer membrane lipoprotein Blc [Halieaceae bacterium]|tara:strand:+ start:2056 stop:2571 length:516 start_codon:yes stop_codon:yes gene_type:complete
MLKRFMTVCTVVFITACTGLPDNVEPVRNFDPERYLGTWYEIARLDHSFERDLERVTATYELNDDGSIAVLNKGFNTEKGEWRQAEGVAKPMGSSDIGHLKVSFFGPFYGTYAVFELADDYSYAFVSGYNTDYLWLLAREPQISVDVRERFMARSQALGFETADLIWVATE